MYGWAGTVLRVNLTRKEISKEKLNEDFARKWLGGEGFGAKVLWDEVGPDVEDGLDPRNLLIYTTGPLTSTLAPGCGRLEIVTKSPITGIFGDSNAGGDFAPEIKQAGYDMIIIEGEAEKPVLLWIHDDRIEIRDASHLWGKTVSETDRAVKKELGDSNIQVSCIGPAGENKIRFSVLMNNLDRAPGWSGCGAVAGSKRLKAIAVRGTKGVKIARPHEFEEACWEAREKIKDLLGTKMYREQGTMFLIRAMYLSGVAQMHNYGTTQCPESHLEQISGEKWVDEYVVKEAGNQGCYGCNIQCGHYIAIEKGPYAGLRARGFEYGALCGWLLSYGSSNLAFAQAASHFCNDYGLDAAEPSYTIAWLTDCFKRGIINEKDTDGLTLEWGDEKVALELLRKIVYREGIGDLLAEGMARAARKIGRGSEYYAQTIKGRINQENPSRAFYGCALATATATRGADHLKGFPVWEEIGLPPELSEKYFGNPDAGDRFSHKGKAPMVTYYNRICTLCDLLGVCKFHSRWSMPLDGLTEEDYAKMTSAATGIDFTTEELMRIADRVYNLERAYNVRLGMTRKDDMLPEMYFKEPLNTGPMKGHIIEKEKFEEMLEEYYLYQGLDVETAIPTRKTLEELDLKEVADELEQRGILSS